MSGTVRAGDQGGHKIFDLILCLRKAHCKGPALLEPVIRVATNYSTLYVVWGNPTVKVRHRWSGWPQNIRPCTLSEEAQLQRFGTIRAGDQGGHKIFDFILCLRKPNCKVPAPLESVIRVATKYSTLSFVWKVALNSVVFLALRQRTAPYFVGSVRNVTCIIKD